MIAALSKVVAGHPHKVQIHPEYIGYMVRNDGWATTCWDRGIDWSVLYFVERGEIRLEHQSVKMTVTPGDGVYIGGCVQPMVRFSNPIELREIWFRMTHQPPTADRTSDQMLRFRAPVEGAALVDHMAAERADISGRNVDMLLPCRLSLLLALCAQEIALYHDAVRKLSPSQRIRLVRWVRQNLASRPSPAKAADRLGLSPDYFGRLFRNTFGQAPRDWLIRQRILTARRLLDEGVLSTSEVMQQCGFDNIAHFSRQMKRLTGKTPGGRSGWTHRKK